MASFSEIKKSIQTSKYGDTITVSGNIDWDTSSAGRIDLPSGITIIGQNAMIKSNNMYYVFQAMNKRNIVIKNIGFKMARVINAINDTNILIDKITLDGEDSGKKTISQLPFQINGCDSVAITNCNIKNCRDMIHTTMSTIPSNRVYVRNDTFSMDNNNYRDAYPVCVYAFHVDSMWVDGCVFQDVIPGKAADEEFRYGYGVCESDGKCKYLSVTNCRFLNNTDNDRWRGIHISHAERSFIFNNTFESKISKTPQGVICMFVDTCLQTACIIKNNLSGSRIVVNRTFNTGGLITIINNNVSDYVGAPIDTFGHIYNNVKIKIISNVTIATAKAKLK